MGLFNHLFGSDASIAREFVMDDDRRLTLWDEHLAQYTVRENLCRHFNYRNVDQALQDWPTTENILQQLASLISPALITIKAEEKTDDEIIADLKRLKTTRQLEQFTELIVKTKKKYSGVLDLFHEINAVLVAELHLIRILKKQPVKELMLKLFEIIYHHEARLYKLFKEHYFSEESKPLHADIKRIASAVLLQQAIEEEEEKDEEKFANELLKRMDPQGSRHSYRKLGEDLFDALAEKAGAPFPREEKDFMEGLRRMERMLKDDDLLRALAKKLRPRYDETKIKAVIIAFRQAYDLGHFLDREAQFAT